MIGRSVPVFCYHNVSDVDGHAPARFEEHLRVIASAGYRTIGAVELLEITLGKRPLRGRCCVLTFDDAHLSNWLVTAPLLRKHGMTGVFFALADFTVAGPARTPETAPALRTMPDSFRLALSGDMSQFMNESELKALVRDYGMEVHAHGRRHQGAFRTLTPRNVVGGAGAHWSAHGIYDPVEPGLPIFDVGSAYVYDGFWPRRDERGLLFRLRSEEERRAFCREDFRVSLERMRKINGGGPQLFCWPWGHFDAVSEEELKRAGFDGAFSLERGPNAKGTDPFRLKRIGVSSRKSGAWVRARLAMYGTIPGARVFFKFFRKRPEPRTIMLATDSVKLSGGSRQLVNNAEALREMGLTVLAAVPESSALAPELRRAGVPVLAWDRFRDLWATARFFRAAAREHGLDALHVFHNHAYKPAILARFLGSRHRLFLNRGVIFQPNLLAGLWARLSSGFICNSLECARVLRRHGVAKSRLNVVYNSFLFDGPPPGDAPPRRKRGLRVIYVGNEAPAKGFDVFVASIAALQASGLAKDMEFVACGTRPAEAVLPILPPGVAERLRLTGTITHDEVLRELAAADVLALTSRQESLPNVLLEAFMAGLPVVCTSVGGIPELVRHEVNGLLCQSEDSLGLAEAYYVLAGDPAARLRMGRINRRVVTGLLDNRTKGRNLVRVYSGERLYAPLSIDELAASVPMPEAGEAGCSDRKTD
ncbi:glycosyltransferase [Desulfovibrio aminophilus]|uniref:glycosyltransferase n=1 Tax=Desulfovibrio aminophilus TaxID=81425 RepID=UPI00040517BB|nr:glycosyltransferase [Desulfovibrio aminophilus]